MLNVELLMLDLKIEIQKLKIKNLAFTIQH